MSDKSNTATSGANLSMYVALLVLDKVKLDYYVQNPDQREETAKAAGLSQEEIRLVTTGCIESLCVYLKDNWPAPVGGDDPEG